MAKYLIDANLPYYFSLWNNNDFIHQYDLNDCSNDQEIWDFAKLNNLIIVTKDADFTNMILYKEPPPKVIHLRVGNMKIKEFHKFIVSIWHEVETLSNGHKLVNVFQDRLEAIE